MAYKDILVYLDPTDDSQNRLKAAIALAAAFGATLTGMDACSQSAYGDDWLARASVLQDDFENAIKEAKVEGVYRSLDRSRRKAPHNYAHFTDLIIGPSPESEDRDLIAPGVPEEILLTAGVPVILMPPRWRPQPLGENIVIAWKSSREATRAVHDAMPLLRKAKSVLVFTYAPETTIDGRESDQAVAMLARHGVKAEASTWPATGAMSPVDALFATIGAQNADLIVSGAFGHSRLLEGLFGGVSRDLSRQTSFPVLMAH